VVVVVVVVVLVVVVVVIEEEEKEVEVVVVVVVMVAILMLALESSPRHLRPFSLDYHSEAAFLPPVRTFYCSLVPHRVRFAARSQ